MLLASDLIADIEFLVDDENSERYDFASDYQPALNMAVRYIMSAFDKAFDRGVLSPSVFTELLFGEKVTPVAITDEDAVRAVVPTVASMWRLVAVDPAPKMDSDDYIMPTTRLAKFVSFDNSGGPTEDPFAVGYTDAATDVANFSYSQFNIIDPSGTPVRYVVIRPAPTGDIAFIYLMVPTKIIATNTTIEFPYILHQPLVMKAYQYMMIQAGREAITALQISDKDVQELIGLFK